MPHHYTEYPCITLKDCEAEIAIKIGVDRFKNNKKRKEIKDQRIEPGDDDKSMEISILGALGEFSFAKFFNVFPDLSVVYDFQKIDIVLPDGSTMDAKAPLRHGEYYWVRDTKRNSPSDNYGFTYIRDFSIFPINAYIIGYISKEDLFLESNLSKSPHREGYDYRVHYSQLTSSLKLMRCHKCATKKQ